MRNRINYKVVNQLLSGDAKSIKTAFTLAEMTVVLLIMSIIMAAMAPVMTTRMAADKSVENSSPWKWVEDRRHIDAYLKGNFENQRGAIGQREIAVDGTENARLILNTSDAVPNHIMFKKGSDVLGIMRFFSRGSIAIGKDALSDDATGSDNIAFGTSALNSNTDGDNNIAIGVGALNKNTTGYFNVAVGTGALLSNTTSSRNVAIGAKALQNNTIAQSNVAVGSSALRSNTTGIFNVAVGTDALLSNTTGTRNVAIGAKALNKNITSKDIVALGFQALEELDADGSRNIAIGSNALRKLKKGENNIAIGVGTGGDMEEGDSNIIIGRQLYARGLDSNNPKGNIIIGEHSNVGGNNIILGHSTGINITGGTGNTILGHAAGNGLTTGSNKICIGSGSCADGTPGLNDDVERIYLGTQNTLQIVGGDAKGNLNDFPAVVINGNLIVRGAIYTPIRVGQSATTGREYGILTTHDDLEGDIPNKHVTALYPTGGYTPSNVDFSNISSDRRLKNVGKAYTSSLDKIRQIKPFNYTFKNDKEKTPRVGVIAQDLQKIFPNAVKKDSKGFLTIRQEDMFYAAINAIKELDAKITQLIETLNQVQREIYALRQENKEIKKRLDALEKK